MSRVTPPVNKAFGQFVRSISSTTRSPSPSTTLLNSNDYLPRRLQDLKAECSRRQLSVSGSKSELAERLVVSDSIITNPHPINARAHSTLAPHRPHIATPTTYRIQPLMQGFKTSSPAPGLHDSSTIDYFVFPEFSTSEPLDSFSRMRVPLLPDNYAPDRSIGTGQEAETLDGPIAGGEILVVAAHPEMVLPAAMTEVVGNEAIDDVRLTMAYENEPEPEQSGFKALWSGIVEDVLGPKGGSGLKPAM